MLLLFTETDSNKFFSVSRVSRDFLGGLAAIFAARRRLSKIFAAGGRLSRRLRGQSLIRWGTEIASIEKSKYGKCNYKPWHYTGWKMQSLICCRFLRYEPSYTHRCCALTFASAVVRMKLLTIFTNFWQHVAKLHWRCASTWPLYVLRHTCSSAGLSTMGLFQFTWRESATLHRSHQLSASFVQQHCTKYE